MTGPPGEPLNIPDQKLIQMLSDWRSTLIQARKTRQEVWDECWSIYRGEADYTSKQPWQAKIVLPKAWNAVEQAVSIVRRLLDFNKEPWTIEAINPAHKLQAARMTRLVRLFLEKADFSRHFFDGLKIAFITGTGVWKVWWDFVPRPKFAISNGRAVRQIVNDGMLRIKEVDPNAFFWLPGFIGTLEIHEVPKHKLIQMAQSGLFPIERLRNLPESTIPEHLRASNIRFGEGPRRKPIPTITILEYYGPVILNGVEVEPAAHIIAAGDRILRATRNVFWTQRPPYVTMSPLSFPLRDTGIGLIEMNRSLHANLNEIMNMSIDMLLYRLLPVFEVYRSVYDNPEALGEILRPGTVLFKNNPAPGLNSVQFPDISSGAMAVMAALDRAIQEGSLVSEIQQAIPRWRGVQTATEVNLKADNQASFFGSLATEIEEHAIKPIVQLAIDYILQFLVLSNDPRIPEILGVDSAVFATLSREEIAEMINGDFEIKVAGVVEQLEDMEALQGLMQILGILGQNPAWIPYLNQTAMLDRITRAFRHIIPNLHEVVESPQAVQEKLARLQQLQADAAMVKLIPELLKNAANTTGQSPA